MALPPTGARLVLASDGLWDAVSIKDVCHFAKGMPAPAAAGQARSTCQWLQHFFLPCSHMEPLLD